MFAQGDTTTTEAPATTDAPATTEAPATTDAPATTEAPAEGDSNLDLTELTGVPPEDVITPREEDEPDAIVILPDRDDENLFVLGETELTGTIVDSAEATLNPQTVADWQVVLDFTVTGGIEFDALAAEVFGQQLAIVLDGIVQSAPTINATEFNGTAVISGDFTEEEAKDLATVLNFGALPVELEPVTVQTVSATLGEDALSAGVAAGIVGLILVGIFMYVFYRLLGLVAVGSLLVSGGLLYFIVSWLGEVQGLTLTLAGATGIIVSIGVQVDSNIVYYERLKEEMLRGRSLRVAADTGFQGRLLDHREG